jgi:putative phosphoesterase
MRIAVISDVHGNLAALEAVLADIPNRAPDMIVNLGDWVTSPLWPRETMERLDGLSLPSVRGNHDRWLGDVQAPKKSNSIAFTHAALTAAQREQLAALPATLSLDGGRILAVHGTPASDTGYLLEERFAGQLCPVTAEDLSDRLGGNGAELVLCGHSHRQQIASASNGCLVVNPGAVGCPRYADNPDFVIAEAGSPHARYAIVTRRGLRWSVELLALEYDWDAVAERARVNGRADWAAAFMRLSR